MTNVGVLGTFALHVFRGGGLGSTPKLCMARRNSSYRHRSQVERRDPFLVGLFAFGWKFVSDVDRFVDGAMRLVDEPVRFRGVVRPRV
jgi:hypothetical protein